MAKKMSTLITALRWIARLDFLAALIMGLVLWSGSPALLKAHIATGFVLTLTLLLVALLGFASRIGPVLPLVGIAWAILLPYFGFAQLRLLPGAGHFVIQLIHLLIGIGAIGLVEALGARSLRASAGTPARQR